MYQVIIGFGTGVVVGLVISLVDRYRIHQAIRKAKLNG